MPTGGDGFYYFSMFLLGDDREINRFDIEFNGDILCTIFVDQQDDITDYPQSACSASIYAAEGILGSLLQNKNKQIIVLSVIRFAIEHFL